MEKSTILETMNRTLEFTKDSGYVLRLNMHLFLQLTSNNYFTESVFWYSELFIMELC